MQEFFQTVTPIDNPPSLSIDNDTDDDKHCMTRCHANPDHKIQFIKIRDFYILSNLAKSRERAFMRTREHGCRRHSWTVDTQFDLV